MVEVTMRDKNRGGRMTVVNWVEEDLDFAMLN
jgi:hypothetical protein